MNEEEEIDSEMLHRQSTTDSQVTQKTTPLAVIHGVTSLQKLQLEPDDTCVLPPDAGTCRDYVPRWFYNSQTGKCEQFSYGSCGGNSNNFLDRQACEGKCSRGMLIIDNFKNFMTINEATAFPLNVPLLPFLKSCR